MFVLVGVCGRSSVSYFHFLDVGTIWWAYLLLLSRLTINYINLYYAGKLFRMSVIMVLVELVLKLKYITTATNAYMTISYLSKQFFSTKLVKGGKVLVCGFHNAVLCFSDVVLKIKDHGKFSTSHVRIACFSVIALLLCHLCYRYCCIKMLKHWN